MFLASPLETKNPKKVRVRFVDSPDRCDRSFRADDASRIRRDPMPSPAPSLSPVPQGTEVAFVQQIQKDLTARFPTPADAVNAGYFRYGNEDEDGAISYANLQWQSGDPQHPSQLWYDVKGNLLGADFSVLQSLTAAAEGLGRQLSPLGLVPRAHPLRS